MRSSQIYQPAQRSSARLRLSKILTIGTAAPALCGLLFAALAIQAEPPNIPKDAWPGWRGPAGNGLSTLTGLPSSWDAARNVAWKTPVEGRGHSSPVVWGKRIFLTTDIEGEVLPGAGAVKHKLNNEPFVHPDSVGADKKHTLKVLCLDADSGKQLWERTAYEGAVFDGTHRFNTFASPTAVTDGKFVYAYFESQGLYKYDFEGKLLWKMSLGGIATLGVGTGVSPVLFEDKIIILADQDNGENSFIAAVSTADGKIAWKDTREATLTWMTPVLIEVAGRTQLITAGTENVIAYDPRSGKEIWKTEGLENNVVHTPVFGNGMVIVSSGYPGKKVIGLRLEPKAGEDRVAWRYAKGVGYITSPILYGDYLYLMTDSGLLTCLDARTGEVKYEAKRFPKPGQFSGAPVAIDGKLMITSRDGDTYVVKAGPVHEILGTNSLGENVFASLALAGDSIYIRAEKNLYRIREVKKQ
jgi:outer membrane protein assembly factor BamB